VSARIFHENGTLCEPEVLADPCLPGFHRILGPDKIPQLLWGSDDERLSAYRGKVIYAEDMSLEDAIKRSQSYIEACSDPRSVTIDEYSYAVGGHIHIATVTPERGFEWRIKPQRSD